MRAREVRPGDVTLVGVVVEIREPLKTLVGYTCYAAKTDEGAVLVDTMLNDTWVELLAMVNPEARGVQWWNVR